MKLLRISYKLIYFSTLGLKRTLMLKILSISVTEMLAEVSVCRLLLLTLHGFLGHL